MIGMLVLRYLEVVSEIANTAQALAVKAMPRSGLSDRGSVVESDGVSCVAISGVQRVDAILLLLRYIPSTGSLNNTRARTSSPRTPGTSELAPRHMARTRLVMTSGRLTVTPIAWS
jgi:hypothetical protein